jgi:hypothetical protein
MFSSVSSVFQVFQILAISGQHLDVANKFKKGLLQQMFI